MSIVAIELLVVAIMRYGMYRKRRLKYATIVSETQRVDEELRLMCDSNVK